MSGKSRSTSSKPCATAFIDEEFVSTFFAHKYAAVFGGLSWHYLA